MDILTIGIIGAVVVVALILVGLYFSYYNRIRQYENQIDEAWSQIDVQLKKRYDLVPNLVETVKGYATHEREIFEKVAQARAGMIGGTPQERMDASNMLTSGLRQLFAVAEAYPQLKANENYLALQEELATTENKIGFARQYYNDVAKSYKNRVEVFPSNMIANMFGFKAEPFFQLETAGERAVPQVKV